MRQFIAERPLLQRLLTLGTMLLVVGTLLLLANTLTNAEFQRGNGLSDLLNGILALFTERSAPEPLVFPPVVWDIITAVFWLLFLFSTGYLILTRDGRREIPRLVRLFARGFILAWVVFLVLRLDNAATEEVEEEQKTSGERADLPFDDLETVQLAERLEDFALVLPESPSAQTALRVIGVIFTVVLLLLIWRWWNYQQELKAFSELPLDELRLRALEALLELREGDVPLTDLIRRCYREMVQTVQEQRGVYRERHITPREFEQRLLRSGFPQPPVQRLTRLFEQVRYGNSSVGEREKRQAIDSLEEIVAACEQLGTRRRLPQNVA
ncbi:DUF4129 domain-containing protein [Candidatus Leptofilum sp.]|uniref:DUF4129 domain-containing protein n=1 Tax=Candidatus Leptofilum sp. TaxID=3241576 RepID=UPI003B5928C3